LFVLIYGGKTNNVPYIGDLSTRFLPKNLRTQRPRSTEWHTAWAWRLALQFNFDKLAEPSRDMIFLLFGFACRCARRGYGYSGVPTTRQQRYHCICWHHCVW